MDSGKERAVWSAGGGKEVFDVCMWGCDMNKISSVWKHIGGSLGWSSLRPRQAPFFPFDRQAHLLARSHQPWCCRARQSFICGCIYSNSHTSSSVMFRLFHVSKLWCSISLLSASVLLSRMGNSTTLFLPHKHRSWTVSWKSPKGFQLYVFFTNTVKYMGRTLTAKEEKSACENI